MKLRMTLAVVLALTIVALALGSGAAPALAAGSVYRYSFAGKGADGGWTSCPSGPAVNQVCTDTYIGAAEQMYKQDGTQFPSTTLSLYRYSYKIDRKGNWVFVSESYGFGDAKLTVDRQLKVKRTAVNEKGNHPLQVPHESAIQTVRRAGHARRHQGAKGQFAR